MERSLDYRVGPRRMWKAESFDGLTPTVYDWCRMAAFIDGEGNLNLSSNKTRRGQPRIQVRILIGNTNPNLPVWLKEMFGGNVVFRDHKNLAWKRSYIWSCTAARAAWILHNCLPWFLLKQAQAKILLQMQEAIDLTYQGRGRTIPDDEWDRRFALKEQLHKLNAKGRAPVVTEE